MKAIVGTINQGPSRGLLRDCENFWRFVSSSIECSAAPKLYNVLHCPLCPAAHQCLCQSSRHRSCGDQQQICWHQAPSIACTALTRVIVRYYSEIFCIQSHKKLFHWWIPPDCWIRSSVGLRRWQWHVSSQDSAEQLSWAGAALVRVTPAPMTFI